MAIDLWDTAVKVLVVYPGLIATELIDAPGNDPVPTDIEPIDVAEVVTATLDALATDAVQVYVPSFFADIAAGKAANVEGFLSGAAEYVAQQQQQPS
jgi:short-subunit dehydrogenase